jgi:hypothetical protein
MPGPSTTVLKSPGPGVEAASSSLPILAGRTLGATADFHHNISSYNYRRQLLFEFNLNFSNSNISTIFCIK